jgi:hypothetical protein
MHDPSVLVADIKGLPIAPRSWRRWRKFKDRPSLIEVWHEEPDGRDSGTVCGYRAMRWHVHHWRVRVMPIVEQLRRLERCAHCGRRMNRATRFGYMGSGKVWHEECSALGQYRSDRRLLLEVIDRLAGAYGIDDEDHLKSVVTRIERRDQFLLWYRTWQMLSAYRSGNDRWKAPNEHITGE